jgi:hypothetical protein
VGELGDGKNGRKDGRVEVHGAISGDYRGWAMLVWCCLRGCLVGDDTMSMVLTVLIDKKSMSRARRESREHCESRDHGSTTEYIGQAFIMSQTVVATVNSKIVCMEIETISTKSHLSSYLLVVHRIFLLVQHPLLKSV